MLYQTLDEIVTVHPYLDYRDWWTMGATFIRMMATAISAEWFDLHLNDGDLEPVQAYVSRYIDLVYGRQCRDSLIEAFVGLDSRTIFYSGEFDAISYGFYRSAFELIAQHTGDCGRRLGLDRRLFTRRVGERFYNQLHDHLGVDLPNALESDRCLVQLKAGIAQVGDFLQAQGYLRDHFGFDFSIDAVHAGQTICQQEHEIVDRLQANHSVYAL